MADRLFPLGISYAYALRPELAARWEQLYGPGVEAVSVVAFAAELPEGDPVLDPQEHDAFAWYAYDEADTRCSIGRSRGMLSQDAASH